MDLNPATKVRPIWRQFWNAGEATKSSWKQSKCKSTAEETCYYVKNKQSSKMRSTKTKDGNTNELKWPILTYLHQVAFRKDVSLCQLLECIPPEIYNYHALLVNLHHIFILLSEKSILISSVVVKSAFSVHSLQTRVWNYSLPYNYAVLTSSKNSALMTALWNTCMLHGFVGVAWFTFVLIDSSVCRPLCPMKVRSAAPYLFCWFSGFVIILNDFMIFTDS